MTATLKRACLALALVPLLSGCIAILAAPLAAGATLMARSKVRVHAATRPSPSAARAITPTVTLLPVHELPPPSATEEQSSNVAARWREFFDYALAVAHRDPTTPMQSALLVSGGSMLEPDRLPCTARFPAVILDLDPGRSAFAPEMVAPAPPMIAEGLGKLREAGLTVLWITQLPAAHAREVADALKASGLDPEGRDQLLLARSAEDRKQVLRQDANADVCVVAIIGDGRADFDELFDYLRDPSDATALYPMLGKGWFLAPPPGAPAGAATDSLPSWDAPEAE